MTMRAIFSALGALAVLAACDEPRTEAPAPAAPVEAPAPVVEAAPAPAPEAAPIPADPAAPAAIPGDAAAAPATAPVALDLDGPVVLVISRNHLPRGMETIMARLGALLVEAGHPDATVEISQVGSVGAKVDEVLLGRAAAYVFSGGLKEWDAAAPFAVAAQCGYVVSQVDGTP